MYGRAPRKNRNNYAAGWHPAFITLLNDVLTAFPADNPP